MAYETRTSQWWLKPTGVASGGPGVGGTILGVDIFSPETYFLGHARFYGMGIDLNAAYALNMDDEWLAIDVKQAFSPRDLHGANGKVGILMTGVGGGGAIMAASANFRGATFFRNTPVTSVGMVVGFTFGTNMGVWLITSVYCDPPASSIRGQGITRR